MFYSQLILAKKGPLGTIWIAAHLERKLRKNQVTETNIGVSVDSILFPEAPIALRLSGHLLLGVVRIYSRKVNYLFHDCSEALTKIKQAFHAGAVDLPPESSTAPFHAITLPENFDLDEFEPLAERESSLLASGAVDQHVTTRELITLQDPLEENIYLGSQFGLDGVESLNAVSTNASPTKLAQKAVCFLAMIRDGEGKERLPQANLPHMGLDFEEQFKCFLVTNLRSEGVCLNRHTIYMREYDLMENLAEVDGGNSDDLDFSNSEEREKEAEELERSPSLAFEEEVAPSVEEYRIDFDRLDQMEAMDMEQLQPMTPAPPSMMALDEEMEDRPGEQPEELEQLAPVEEDILDPGQMELVDVPRTLHEKTQAEGTAELEEQVSRSPELEARVEAGAQEAGEDIVEVPDELVPALEAAAEQLPKVVSPGHLSLELEDVPEVETLRSAVDAPINQAPDLFAFEKETAGPSEDLPARDADQPMVDIEQPLEFIENVEELQETSAATIQGLTSPRRRSSPDLPADDDVLRSLLGGRSTPPLRVMPTPSEEAYTRRAKRAPKPPPRKRKPVIDVATVLHGDVMREQLANTTGVRRVRKKAPCTRSELWTAQRQSTGLQVFNEPSIPGVSNALRELYARVLVTGAADIPLADPRREITPEVAREDVSGTSRAEVPIEELLEEAQLEPSEPAAEFIDEPGLEAAVVEPAVETVAELQPETGLDLPAEVDTRLQPEHRPEEAQDLNKDPTEPGTTELLQGDVQQSGDVAAQSSMELREGTIPTEQDVEFPVLETEPGVASEPPVPSSAPTEDPILLSESEVQEEAEVKDEAPVKGLAEEFDPMEEDVQLIEFKDSVSGEGRALVTEQPELLQQVAAEAETVAEAVAGGEAVVVEGVDGRTIIVLEDDGTIIDEGPSQFPVKDEVVDEETNEEELGFLGEPRETVFLQDDDDDLHEEAEDYDDSVQDVTLQAFGGWSARTRAVGGYLQGVFDSLNAVTEIREKEESPKIGLDRTLRGKTRKEAARLFFETLVLKTKDYVDVEQPQPYSEIYLLARPKLTKASF